jgi:hypothetical protein
MSEDQIIEYRLSRLEECYREQTELNKTITESLHRIELAIGTHRDTACPKPGHCIHLERDAVAQNQRDKERFEEIEDAQEKLSAAFLALEKQINLGLGALGVLIPVMSFLAPYLMNHFFNK